MKSPKLNALAGVLITAMALTAMAQDKKGVTPGEANYQAAGSPLATVPMVQSTNPKAPPMTVAEFDDARNH